MSEQEPESDGLSNTSLTKKQEAFCWLYANPPPIGAESAADAYVRAFSYDKGRGNAAKCASHLLQHSLVQKRIAEIRRVNAERSQVTTDQVIAEYARMAFARITDYVRWDAEGKVQVIPSDELTSDQAAAVREFFGRDNWKGQRVRLHEKIAALDRLAKCLGLFTEKVDVTSGGQPIEALTDEERARRIVAILDRARQARSAANDGSASSE